MNKSDDFDDEREPLVPKGPLQMTQGQFEKVMAKKPFVATCPTGFFNLRVADHPVIIVDRRDDGNWQEVLVYDRELRCSMHVKCSAITPADDAAAAIEFLSRLK